jgi:hypothetical protein
MRLLGGIVEAHRVNTIWRCRLRRVKIQNAV